MMRQLTMPQGALQHLSAKRISTNSISNAEKRLETALYAPPQRWAVQLELPVSVKQLAMDAEAYEPMGIEELPDVITNNPVW